MECQQEGDEKEDNLPGNVFVKRQSSPLCHFNLKHSHLTLLCISSTALSHSTPPSHGSGLSCYSIPYAEQGLGSSIPRSCQIQVMGFPLTHIQCSHFPHFLSSVFLPMDITRWESCHQVCIGRKYWYVSEHVSSGWGDDTRATRTWFWSIPHYIYSWQYQCLCWLPC